MKIAIIGAGAMGCLFGALLKESGADVHLLDIAVDHVAAINRRGLTLEHEGCRRRVTIPATTRSQDIGPVELAIVFVKSTATGAAVKNSLGLLGAQSLVLTLQNGLGNPEIIAEHIPAGRVLAGTTAQGATLLGPGAILHAGTGITRLGFWQKNGAGAIEPVLDLMNAAGIETEVVDDVRALVWNKLLINIGINAITALTGIRNGQLPELAVTREISRMAVREAQAVAQSLGIAVMPDAAEHVFAVARATGANRSSMGQDVDARRLTEIGTINGKIVELARRQGLDAPVNFTLTALVETLQTHYPE